MAIGKVTRADDRVTVTSTEGDVFLFKIGNDKSLEQDAAAAWSQDRRPSKAAGKARIAEAHSAAVTWLTSSTGHS